MVALAWLKGAMAPVPEFILTLSRIGPFTTTIAAIELVVLPRALTPVAAKARITGKYSGRAPAMTALTATFSTVNSQSTRNWFERMCPTTSSGLRLVWASISATRFSVGKTIGSLSVQLFSKKRRCRFSSPSLSTSLGVERLPRFGIVLRVDTRHLHEPRRHRRHMLGKPIPYLAKKKTRVVETRVDQIDRLAIETFQPRCHRLRRYLRRIAHRIQHRNF